MIRSLRPRSKFIKFFLVGPKANRIVESLGENLNLRTQDPALVGTTLLIKNLFGMVPSVKYNWLTAFLYWHGIMIASWTSTVPSVPLFQSLMESSAWRETAQSRVRRKIGRAS